jgi:large subunit ribosomal protein L25
MELTVECQKRPEGSKPNALRRTGLIPANLYGHKGTESISLTLNAKEAERLLKKAAVNNTIVQLNIPEINWRGQTIIREVQKHPAKGSLYHLSFFSVAAQESLNVEVAIHIVGEAPGVKQEGGVLDPVLTHLEVSCAPSKIPDVIEVDVSQLNLKDTLYVDQIALPEGVTVLGDPGRAIVSVLPSTTRSESEAIAEETVTETDTGTGNEAASA